MQLWADLDDVDELYADVVTIMAQCKFSNCTHQKEPGCAVQAALASGGLSRAQLERYLTQIKEVKRLEDKRKVYERKIGKKSRSGQSG